MNPFTIGQTLTVVFGNRQPMRVVALRTDACLMRLPHSTPMSKWYSVADLRQWNPVTLTNHYKAPQKLTAGDTVFLGGSISRWFSVRWVGEVYEYRRYPKAPHVVELRRLAILRDVESGQIRIHVFINASADGRVRVQEAS